MNSLVSNKSGHKKPDILTEYLQHGGLSGYLYRKLEDELKNAKNDLEHPLRACALALQKGDVDTAKNELLKKESAFEWLSVMGVLAATESANARANKEAEELLSLLHTGTMEDFAGLPPVDGLTLLAVIVKVDDTNQEKARKIISDRNKRAAQNKRPLGQHVNKPRVFSRYNQWKANLPLYKNKADFIRAMQTEFGISKTDTISKWIKDWEASSS